jgi:glycosyltransferase involved in cell wall biosynthesis
MTDTFTRYLLAAGGVSVVVPVYKSASSLPLLHDRLNAVLTPLPCAWEIVFVNDASPDICDTVLDSLRLSHPHLTVITLAANCGQHRAIFHGICQARYPVIITLDDESPDLIENGQIDLGQYAVEQLALRLDPFPRKPGAEFVQPPEPAEISPFAVLKQLRASDEG